MARETDFLDLYKILAVRPDCDLAEFKHAYRRRVLILHPDRRAGGRSDLIASERLQQLTALYRAAMKFHREHGRLPGAAGARPAEPVADAGNNPQVARANAAGTIRAKTRWWWLATAAVLVSWLIWNNTPPAPDAVMPVRVSASASRLTPADPPVLEQTLKLGMEAAMVRSIEGEPIMVNGDRWDYGPSWILFNKGRVVDWYSSDMQPLHATHTPTAVAHP